jgi:hypothetical protein
MAAALAALAALAAVAVLAGAAARGQAPPLPAAPLPVTPAGPGGLLGPPTLGPPVAAPGLPPPPPPPPPSPLLPPPPPPPPLVPVAVPGAWGPYTPPEALPGLFFGVELQFLRPALKNRLEGIVPLPDGTVATVNLPSANLQWTVAPVFEIGYRSPDLPGLVALNYRFLLDTATTTAPVEGIDSSIRTRVTLNEITLDYGFPTWLFAPRWELNTRLGAQLADLYFDSRAGNPFLSEQESSNFYGAGPHLRADLERHIAFVPGLSLFGRGDGVALIGQTKQRFRAQALAEDGTVLAGSLEQQRQAQLVPVLTLDAGLEYTPPNLEFLHFGVGYMFQRYFNLGHLNNSMDGMPVVHSSGELTTQGVYVRGRIDF